MSASSKPYSVGGKLKLKGSGVSSGGATKKRKATEDDAPAVSDVQAASSLKAEPVEAFLTEAQRRHKQKKIDLEDKMSKELVQTSYRDRIEKFNNRLATTTEHNDLPRISAAGNG